MPTGKMSAVVGLAKSVYNQLISMGVDSIDGDSLDLWIYVTLKANIPELVSGWGKVGVVKKSAVGWWENCKTTLHSVLIFSLLLLSPLCVGHKHPVHGGVWQPIPEHG